MTSSLVGSEMCIRDSNEAGSIRSSDRPGFSTSSTWEIRKQKPDHRLSSVSYTHLTLPTICSV
eukprot:863835-Prorocentrum_lima.AAC.1